jgi:hypothetical protein
MMYYKQFSNSRPWAVGLSAELYSQLHGRMQHNGWDASGSKLCTECLSYDLYDFANLNFVTKFVSILDFAFNETVTSKSIPWLLAIYRTDLKSNIFAWPVQPSHTHWWNILSHNSVTEIKKELTRSKVGTQFAFTRDRTSKLTIWL